MFESKYLHWFRLLGVAVLRGYHTMKRSVEQCRDLNKPNLLIATRMRKMMATVTQVRTGCNHHIYKQEFSPYPGPSKGVFLQFYDLTNYPSDFWSNRRISRIYGPKPPKIGYFVWYFFVFCWIFKSTFCPTVKYSFLCVAFIFRSFPGFVWQELFRI